MRQQTTHHAITKAQDKIHTPTKEKSNILADTYANINSDVDYDNQSQQKRTLEHRILHTGNTQSDRSP